MTLAELISTVEHAKAQAAAFNIAPHQVQVKVNVEGQGQILDLYPGSFSKDKKELHLEAE